MLIFGTNIKSICETKKYQTSVFNMKDLNETDTILGIKGKGHKRAMHYVNLIILEKVLLKFKHLKIGTENTPLKGYSLTNVC